MGAPGGKAQWLPKQSRSRDALCHLWVLRDLGSCSRDGCPTWEKSARLCWLKQMQNTSEGSVCDTGGAPRAAPMGARSKERAGAGTAAEQMCRGGPSRASPALSTSRLPGIPLIYSRNLGLTGTRVLLGWGGAEGGPWEAEAEEKHFFFFFFPANYKQGMWQLTPSPQPPSSQSKKPNSAEREREKEDLGSTFNYVKLIYIS